ncbi:MAG: hypothetical protein ACK5CY_13170, partial [Bacteroidia bacterium]
VKEYLMKYSKYLSSDDLESKKRNFSENIDKLLITTYIKNQDKNIYSEYSSMWKRYKTIQEEIPSNFLKELPKTAERVPNICNLLFELIERHKSVSDQENFLRKVNEDFPSLYKGYSNLFWFILDKQKNVTGTVRIFNNSNIDSYIRAIVTNPSNDIRFRGRESFQYSYEKINSLEIVDQEEITYKNGRLGGIQKCFKGRTIMWSLEITDNNQWKYSYYFEGLLVKTITYTSQQDSYEYDFKNGVNLTLKELDEKIERVRELARKEDFYNANSLAQDARDNNLPSDLKQNVILDDLIYKLNYRY